MDIKKTRLLYLLLIPSLVFAHGGRTDKYGCHNDRKNGGYHCHNSGTTSQSLRTTTNSTNTNSAKPQALTAQQTNSQVRDANLAAYKDLVLKIQSALNQLGYSAGTPDGVLGKQTIKAIKHFQVDSDLAVDGKPSYLLLENLLGKVEKL